MNYGKGISIKQRMVDRSAIYGIKLERVESKCVTKKIKLT